MEQKRTDAERALVGGLLLDASPLDDVCRVTSPDELTDPDLKKVFEAILALDAKGAAIDSLTVSEHVGGQELAPMIGALARDTPSARNSVAYAQMVAAAALRRRVAALGKRLIEAAHSDDLDETLAVLQDEAVDITAKQSAHGPRAIREFMPEWIDRLDNRVKADGKVAGITTGITDFDKMTQGLEPGALYILAARPSMGKTALSLDILRHIVLALNTPALMFSLEMPAEQLINRLVARLSGVPMHGIRGGNLSRDELNSVFDAGTKTAGLPFFVDDTPGLSIGELRSRARQAHKRHDIGCIVVDYLQLMCCPSAGSREQEISAISRGLKDVARSLRVPVIALSQLNRSVEQRENKRPRLSDLRESGAIEQDADLVAFLYRHGVYDDKFLFPTVAELNVAKQRNGPLGKVHLHWQDDAVSFSALDRDNAREYERLLHARAANRASATDDL